MRVFVFFRSVLLLMALFTSIVFVNAPVTIAQSTVNVSISRVDEVRIKLMWRLDKRLKVRSGMRLRVEEGVAPYEFRAIRSLPAARSGEIVVRKGLSREARFRVQVMLRGKIVGASQEVIIAPESNVDIIYVPPSGGSQSGGSAREGSSPATTLLAGESPCAPGVEEAVLELITQERMVRGLPVLTRSPRLDSAARIHNLGMVRGNSLSHRGWYDAVIEAGYTPGYLAQNIAMSIRDPQSLVEGWMQSPGHRRNIENESSSETGISCVQGPDGTWWWSHYFASPLAR